MHFLGISPLARKNAQRQFVFSPNVENTFWGGINYPFDDGRFCTSQLEGDRKCPKWSNLRS